MLELRITSDSSRVPCNYLKTLPKVVRWLRRHRITALDQLTQQDLKLGHDHYRPKRDDASWVFGALGRFLGECQPVPERSSPRRVENVLPPRLKREVGPY